MLKYCLIFLFTLSLTEAGYAAPQNEAEKNFKQSYLSCSIISSEHLTILQLYQRGLPRDVAIKSLPHITRAAKKRVKYVYDLAKKIGILNSYADINTNYARCSTLVYQVKGKPAVDLRAHNYYFCSGENKVRYELILMADQQKTLQQLLNSFPARYEPVIIKFYQLIKSKGTLAAFDLTANNLKACLNQIQ